MSTFLNIVESFRSYTILFRKKYYKNILFRKSIAKTYFSNEIEKKVVVQRFYYKKHTF